MKLIIKCRDGGKTLDAVREADEKNIPILCADEVSAKDIKRLAEFDECNVKVFTVKQWKHKQLESRYKNIIVDDIEYVLPALLGTNITLATFTEGA